MPGKSNSKSTLIRISAQDHETLRTLSEKTGHSMQFLLSQAIEWLRREDFFNRLNQAYRTDSKKIGER